MTDTPEPVAADMCDICCRSKSQHLSSDLQCPQTAYFRAMPATRPADDLVRLLVEKLQAIRNAYGQNGSQGIDAAFVRGTADEALAAARAQGYGGQP